jgi:competence protein ComEA
MVRGTRSAVQPSIHALEDIMQRLLLALAFALCSGAALAAINLNTASKDELVALPGIGPAKAQAILDYRSAHGAFKSVEELKDVKGIGAKRFEKLKGELTVVGGPAKAAPGSAEKAAVTSQRTAKGEVTVAAKRDAAAGGKP